MRELLLAFVIALVIGSIINGWPKEKPVRPLGQNQSGQSQSGQGQSDQSGQTGQPGNTTNSSVSVNPSNEGNRDFPDFASFANIDSANFDSQVLKSAKPVFIECYVPNNSACDQMLPLVAAVAKTHQESVTMAKLNVMDNLVLAHRYSVGTVPTFLLFDKGALVSKLNGILPQERLEAMIASVYQNELSHQSASSQQSTASSIQ